MSVSTIYYNQILKITEDYLGPASHRFLDRQIVTHLRKSPEQINKNDISMLAILIRSRLVVLTKDRRIIEEAFRRITSLEQKIKY